MDEHRDPRHPGRLGQTEHLLELHREHRPLTPVLDPYPRTARNLDPLRRQLVQPDRLARGPRQQPPQRLPGVDPPQIGPARRPGQLRLQPLPGPVDQRPVRHVRPGLSQLPVEEGEPLAQLPGLPAPPQQPEPLAPQAFEQRLPHEGGLGRGTQGADRQLDRAQPVHRPRDHVPVLPVDLLAGTPQMPGRPARHRLVHHRREPHPRRGVPRRAVRHRHREPRAAPSREPSASRAPLPDTIR